MDFIAGVVAALATMGIGFLTVDLHEPNILRKDDYSAIVLEADKGVAIEYKIGKGEMLNGKSTITHFIWNMIARLLPEHALDFIKVRKQRKKFLLRKTD